MSEELEWELFDIFEAGLFAFPLYEHQTARRIIRYLLYRGVLAEEIADAIEDSTADLYIWLNRSGKNMVGEWVIAWVNDSREEYKKEKMREAREGGYSWVDIEGGDQVDSDSFGDGFSDGDDPPVRCEGPIGNLDTKYDPISSRESTTERKRKSESNIHQIRPTTDSNCETSDEDDTDIKARRDVSPPPLPPRTHPQNIRVDVEPLRLLHASHSVDTTSTDVSPRSHLHLSFSDEFYQQTPDSGAVSDIYSTIPPKHLCDVVRCDVTPPHDVMEDELNSLDKDNVVSGDMAGCDKESNVRDDLIGLFHNTDVTTDTVGLDNDQTECTDESHINVLNSGLPSCPDCKCKLSYYQLLERRIQDGSLERCLKNGQLPQKDQKDELFLHDISQTILSNSKAMEFDFQTLNRDGPGYIFIMTDAVQNFSPWSEEQRYKIASSRHPERWLLEFRTRRIDVDLIWQVKVKHHIKACREVHAHLQQFNVQSNWFRCSLSTIMETMSQVVRKYRP